MKLLIAEFVIEHLTMTMINVPFRKIKPKVVHWSYKNEYNIGYTVG